MVETTSRTTAQILRISPKVGDLLPNKQLNCPEDDCSSVFTNPANLRMHLERHHHRSESIKTVTVNTSNRPGIPEKWYFCPVEGCAYYDTGKNKSKHFGCLKYLRQHYQKVHAAKVYQCEKCGKTFGTEGMRIAHENVCGQVFKCNECGWSYYSRETLLTHARRKGHVLDFEKIKNETAPAQQTTPSETVIMGTQTTTPIQILVKLSTQTQDQEIQTDPVEIIERKSRGRKRKVDNVKQPGKQTKKSKSISASFSNDSLQMDSNQIVQTTPSESNLAHINYVENNEIEDSINTCLEQLVNSTGSLCHIETQTETFTSNILDQMLYANMHTQTCDEFLSELGLADIQTQTNLSACVKDEPVDVDMVGSGGRNAYGLTSSGAHDEMLVSTETQTSFTQCLLEYNETGTNSNGITQHTQTCDTLLEGLFGGQESDLIGNFQSTYTQT